MGICFVCLCVSERVYVSFCVYIERDNVIDEKKKKGVSKRKVEKETDEYRIKVSMVRGAFISSDYLFLKVHSLLNIAEKYTQFIALKMNCQSISSFFWTLWDLTIDLSVVEKCLEKVLNAQLPVGKQ